ncbi:MAG: hypothetical protein JXQ81_11145 [Desulfuromonadales bacterium]|nr:hypothetical protein [Desulfuromonadales bacterium]
MPHLFRWAGIFLAFSVLASLAAGLIGGPASTAGLFQLVAGVLLWQQVPRGVRRVSLLLLIVGILALVIAPRSVDLGAAISKNQQMIAMFAAIGLLRYSPQPKAVSTPTGPRALWQTLFGLHWLGAVINISSLVIFSDRMVGADGKLQGFQGLMLSRAFSLAALWSPFFVAMGVALTHAPGADYLPLTLWGLPFSQLLLAAMICWNIRTRPDQVAAFSGYAFKPATLIAPVGLAISVLIGHQLFPAVSILTIITLLAPCYPLLASREKSALTLLKDYVLADLPRMGPEIVLFVSAGILGSGLSALVAGWDFSMAGVLNPLVLIYICLAVILAAASVGVHPVVGITVVSGVLSTAQLPPDLLAMCFLFGWGIGVVINPISGVHILLSGRYAYSSEKAWRWNFPFVAVSYVASCAWFGMIYWLG